MTTEPITSPEVTNPTAEKTLTQDEVNAIVTRRVAAAKKGMPDEAELSAFRTWQKSQETEAERHRKVINERDTARSELKAAKEEVETLKRQSYVAAKGLTGDEAEFVIFKASKLVNDTTTFETAVETVLKERAPQQRIDFTAPLTGGGKKDANSFMNDLIRKARQ